MTDAPSERRIQRDRLGHKLWLSGRRGQKQRQQWRALFESRPIKRDEGEKTQ